MILLRVATLFVALVLPAIAIAQDSPLIEGRTADMWIVDPVTDQVTGYDTGQWMNSVQPSDYPAIDFNDNAIFLINNLADSVSAMTPGQPVISLAGIGDAALQAGDGGRGGHRDLTVTPASGSFTNTIAVTIGVNSSLLGDGLHRLTWTAVEAGSGTTVIASGAEIAPFAAGTGENGYLYETFYLVNEGDYDVSVRLQGVAVDVTVTRDYDLVIPPGKERRDTDEDGIPDVVEADIGLNPFEDDWMADTDGDGWSEFDEWLRRYCLDPATRLPLDGDTSCLDADGLPLDSDNDDWSDFDELLRVTNHLDPEPVLTTPPPPGPDPEFTEYDAQQRLRFKDFPAANRLYEIENIVQPGAGSLAVPGLADIQSDQQAAGSADMAHAGIVVQSFTPAQDNIAGIDFRVAAHADELAGVEDIFLNIWAGAPRTGTLLLAHTVDDVEINGDPDRPIIVRFEPVPVVAGQPVYFEFRKRQASLVASSSDSLAGAAVVEVDGAAAPGNSDLEFEVWYDVTFSNGIGGTRAGFQWWTVGAAGLDGTLAYDAALLLRNDEIAAAGLLPADIAPRRQMSQLANALASSDLPEMRLPAGDSIVVSAIHRHQLPAVQAGYRASADYSRLYKHWVPRTNDLSPLSMLAEIGEGAWTTPDEWRREFITYLLPRLVVDLPITLDESSTLEVAVVEAALSEEARLDGSGGLHVINGIYQPGQPVYSFQAAQPVFGDLLSHQSPFINTWEDGLERLATDAFKLDESVIEIRAALGPGQPLEPLGQWLRERFYAGVPGTDSDKYMAQQVMTAFPDVCKVPTPDIAARQADVEGWNDFLDQCPAWVDDAGAAVLLDAMRDRCYAVRLNLLPGSATEIGADLTLLDREADSDADGSINRREIEVLIGQVTLPWMFDTDGDSIADSVDQCPNDPFNDCSANPIYPHVVLDDDFAVYEPETGIDYALVSVQLDRLYDVPVTVCYEAFVDFADTATPGVDYEAVTGCVTIEPGKLSALIRIPINADMELDAGETFTVRITSITNGQPGDDGIVVVTINDPAPTLNTSPVFTSAATVDVAGGTTGPFYTATAVDADGDTVDYGISAGADQALFGIDAVSGELAFISPPDFDAPADANGDNNYEVRLSASDGQETVNLDLLVTVVDSFPIVSVTFPTPNANLGGGVTTTLVRGSVADSTSAALSPDAVSSLTVNGVVATVDTSDDTYWRWSVQVAVSNGPNTLTVDYELADSSSASFDIQLDNFAVHTGFDDIAVDAANNRALLVDGWIDGLLSVDLGSGDRTVLSGNGVGSGLTFNSPRDVVLDAANDRALTVDWNRDAVIAVDLSTGNRTELSGPGAGAGPTLDGPQSLTLDAANNRVIAVATIESMLIAVDLATGDRTVLSSGGTGTGPVFSSPRHVVFDASNNRLLASDSDLDAIIAVDPATGDRTVLSDNVTGTGIELSSPETLAIDNANSRLLVADLGGYVIAVDLASGNRSLIYDLRPNLGVNGARFDGIAVDAANNRALLSESRNDQLLAVNLSTSSVEVVSGNTTGTGPDTTAFWSVSGIDYDAGNGRFLMARTAPDDSLVAVDAQDASRSVLTDSSTGSGPTFTYPQRLTVDNSNDLVFVPDPQVDAVFSVDLATGDRAIVSDNAGTGTGPSFAGPVDVAVDTGNDRLIVLDQTIGIFSVDTVSGDRSIVSDGSTGSGPIWSFPYSMVADFASDVAYVLDYTTDVLYSIDLVSGDRAIVSDNVGVGTGPAFNIPFDMVFDAGNGRVLYVDYGGVDLIGAVDLASGDRIAVSNATTGVGVPLLNPYYIGHDIRNDRIFVYDVAVTGVLVIDLQTGQRAVASKY